MRQTDGIGGPNSSSTLDLGLRYVACFGPWGINQHDVSQEA